MILIQVSFGQTFKFRLTNGDWSSGNYKVDAMDFGNYTIKNIVTGVIFNIPIEREIKLRRRGCLRKQRRKAREEGKRV